MIARAVARGALILAVCGLAAAARTAPTPPAFSDDGDRAAFCAAAAMAGLPPPGKDDLGSVSGFAKHWIGTAVDLGVRVGKKPAEVFDGVNRQVAEISAGFSSRAAPFYDMTACEAPTARDLWPFVPATIDQDKTHSPRSGQVTLDRLADDREVQIFHSLTGRLRPLYAEISAADAFRLDVRILALKWSLARPETPVGPAQFALAQAYDNRRIGVESVNTEQAISAYSTAIGKLSVDDPLWGRAQSHLCFAYFTRRAQDRADNLERAISACQAALPVLEHAGLREAWASTQLVLGGAYHDRARGNRAQNIEAAIAADRSALSARSRAADPTTWATTQINLAAHLADRRVGDPVANVDAAIAANEAAAGVITRQSSPTGWASIMINLAPLYAERAETERRAIDTLEQVLSIADLPGFLRSGAQFHLAEIYRRQAGGERQASLTRAVRLYRQALLGEPLNDRWPILVGRELGASLIALGRYDEADDALLIASRAAERQIGLGLDEAQTRDVLADAADLYALAAFAAAKQGGGARALSRLSAGKARLLFTSLSADDLDLTNAERAELHAIRGQIQSEESGLETLARAGGAADPQAVGSLEALRQRASALYEKGARGALAQPAIDQVVLTGALVAPVTTEFGGLVLVATPGGTVQVIDAPNLTREHIAAVINGQAGANSPIGWRGAHGAAGVDHGLRLVQPALDQIVGSAVRQGLSLAGVAPGSPVVVMPDGAMALLPMGLATGGPGAKTLLEDYEISFAPSLAALDAARGRSRVSARPSLGLLRPPSGAALAYAPVEGALVSSNFGADRRQTWDGADRQTLLSALGRHNYWHFATHGGFDWSDPRGSGLLIGADRQILRVADLLEARRRLGAPRLVVLSACDTGLSDTVQNADEFTGLPTGFLFAGAAGVVASLWPVNDLSTTLLMSRFYDLHLSGRQRPAQALRGAELWLKTASASDLRAYIVAKGAAGSLAPDQKTLLLDALADASHDDPTAIPFSAPRFWGAFVIYGA